VWFPQGSVPDGLSNVAIHGPTTRIQFPRPGEVSPSSSGSKSSGPKDRPTHTTSYGFAYVNDIGRPALGQKPFAFPAGSIIVREKLATLTSPPQVLVVMVKHDQSFNRKANGWEFLTINGDGTKVLKREKEGNCLKCHSAAAGDDFVFRGDGSRP